MADEHSYRHLTEFRVRFADLDSMGHLNSIATLELIETGRVNYMVDLGLGTHDVLTYAIVSLQCDFRAQGYFGELLTCGTRIARFGRSSFVIEHEIWKADGTTLASATTTLVTMAADDPSRSAPVPEDWREKVEQFQGQPVSGSGG